MKVSIDAIPKPAECTRVEFIVVNAIMPTPLGQGTTTTTVGRGQEPFGPCATSSFGSAPAPMTSTRQSGFADDTVRQTTPGREGRTHGSRPPACRRPDETPGHAMTTYSSARTEQSVGRPVAAVASDSPAPTGGSVAALTATPAAARAAMAGRYATDRPQATGLPQARERVARADELRERALWLADADVRAYEGYGEATRLPREPDPTARRNALRVALDAAAAVPTTYLAATAAASAAVLAAENLRGHPANPSVGGGTARVGGRARRGTRRTSPRPSPGPNHDC
jgi:methenyltetrahydrofolate cyclohydrolase